jgi:fluoride exporter
VTTLLVGVADLAGVLARLGFLGGFTTFSTFSAQIVLEVDAGESGRALAYLVASVVGGIAAATAGYVLGRKLA